MDRDEIDRLTHDIAPLTDIYPKRLTDDPWDEQASHRFASTYMQAFIGRSGFPSFTIHRRTLAGDADGSLESCFTVREARYRLWSR